MQVFIRGVGPTRLEQSEFVARGGQGSVYARGDVAFKIYDDPRGALSSSKLAELAQIEDDKVLTPDTLLLDPASRRAVGYTMRFLPNAFSLGQLYSTALCQRHGVTRRQILGLLDSLRQRVESVHAGGALVVDLNEMNFILPPSLDEVFAIDTDSYQTASFPAVAIAANVRDPLVEGRGFTANSDWFSFAVLAFQWLVGVHPYKGKHPSVLGLEKRMAAGISVFCPEVTIPKSCRAMSDLPPSYRGFFEAVFRDGKRLAPPAVECDGTVIQGPPVARPMRAGEIQLHEICTTASDVRHLYDEEASLLLRTKTSAYLDGTRRASLPSPGAELVLTPKMLRPVAAWLRADGGLQLEILTPRTRIETALSGEQLLVHAGRLYLRSGDRLLEIELHDVGPIVIAAARLQARIRPHASKLFPGVVLQSLLGSCYASLLGAERGARQLHLRQLDGLRVVDAKYDRGVLVAVSHDHGRYDRYTYRLGDGEQDLQIERDIDSPTVDFVCLPAGVCVCRKDNDRIELFQVRPGKSKRRIIEDAALHGTTTLARRGSQVVVARGETVLHMTMS